LNIASDVEVQEFAQNRMIAQIGGIVAGLGVLLLLVSFGLQRRRRKFRI
jgi:heme/copper-type cytochrome/quinol oxidase subunit 1